MQFVSRRSLFSLFSLPLLGQPSEAELIEQIRKELVMLPYYGCFDFLTFKLEGSTLTLSGYAMRPSLKEDSERALKGIERVEKIVNEIEVLPLSPNDDQIRWGVFRAIYRDPFFQRYLPGGGIYGREFNRRAGGAFFGGTFERWNRPAGTLEPLGSYPIHIIVKNGNVLLVGIVDNKTDSDRANLLANGVPGVFGVKNLLEVDRAQTSGKKKQ